MRAADLESDLSIGKHSTRSFARFFLRTLIVLLVIAGVSEALLRFGLGLGNPILIIPDSACEYILKPDQNVFRFFVHTKTNHYGMRSDEVPLVRTPGALRILFVGDSITYGTSQVDQHEIFTEILHRDLPAVLHRPVEVLNASAGAWAIDNELSYVRSRGIFQSDLVLLVLNDGDVTQPRSTMAEVGDGLPNKRPATAIGELFTRYIEPRALHMVGHNDAGDSVNTNADGIIRENLADLDQFKEAVTDQGARLIIVYVPFRRDIPDLSATSRSILQAWSTAHKIPMLDLTAAELPYTSNAITLGNGVHFNARGNLIVAEAIEKLWPQSVGK